MSGIDFDWMTSPDEKVEDGEKRIYGVVTGTVLPFLPDPLGLSRVRVSLGCLDSLDPIAWARIASPSAGLFQGNYFIPQPGDSVLVAFEHGDVNVPYIIGALWNNLSRPPVPLAEAQIRTLRTLAGNQIVFTDLPPTITIQTATPPGATPAPPSPAGTHSTVLLTPANIDVSGAVVTIRAGANQVFVSSAGVSLQAGSSFVSLTPDGIALTAGGSIVKLGPEGVLIKGAMVHINPV